MCVFVQAIASSSITVRLDDMKRVVGCHSLLHDVMTGVPQVVGCHSLGCVTETLRMLSVMTTHQWMHGGYYSPKRRATVSAMRLHAMSTL